MERERRSREYEGRKQERKKTVYLIFSRSSLVCLGTLAWIIFTYSVFQKQSLSDISMACNILVIFWVSAMQEDYSYLHGKQRHLV